MDLPVGDPRHGLNGYRNLGCKCAICTQANRVEHARYMANHPEQRDKHRERMAAIRAQRPSRRPPKSPRWPLCAIEGCPYQSSSNQLCRTHYRHLVKYGDPLASAPPRVDRTECRSGHALTDDNVRYETRNGRTHRRCRACLRDRRTKRRQMAQAGRA